MPGVHVRTLSQLDWLDQEKEPLLTIPGSYWLCHKKNIYKFIFRYHRTVKNTMHFSYGRELLKVIRRIIKCHPCQGQQFGTQHLLVTYSCTSWTRQDKMFAILKFEQKRNAAAFSHAFVLTIKICSSSEYSERNMKQHSINHTQDHTQELSLKTTKRTSEVEIKETDVIDQKSESITIQKQNQQMQNIQKYKTYSSLKLPTEIVKDGIDKLPLPNGFSLEKNLIKKDSTCTVNNKDNLDDNKEMISETTADASNVPYQYFIEKEIENAKQNMKSDTFLVIDQPMQKDVEAEIKNINEDSTTNVIKNVIKKKNKSAHTRQEEHYNEIPDLKSQRNDKQHIQTSMHTDNNQSQNNAYIKSYNKARKQKNREFEKKTISDDKILRSSNITDLVMEGLMFTIRQDQDSIAVIEQKTKLEVDEVLENSEKVETKAGEKCLLNSSLLRLENLVKMIDLPSHKDEHHKADHAISNGTYSSPFDIFPNSSIHNSDINYVQRKIDNSNVPTYNMHNMDHLNPSGSGWKHQCISSNIKKITTEKSEQLMEWQSSDNEQGRKDRNDIEIEKKEEKDITLEVFKSTIFPSDKTNVRLENRDLLKVDINIKETDKSNTSVEGHYSSLLPSILSNPTKISMKKNSTISKESSSTKLPRQETNVPRIVSDKVITVEQMPLTLQNVVRHTYRTRRFSSKTNNEMIQHKRKIQRHNTTLTMDAISETGMNNSSSIESAIDTEEMKNKDESYVTINKDVSKINRNTYERNIKEKNNETHCTLQRNSSFKHSSPRKLQDITDDFYYDLSHMHNRDNAIQQRCLRQRRSLNNPDDIKNGNVHIEMLKFIQDITEGARVVVRRLNMEKKRDSKSNLLEEDSTLAMYTH